MVTSLSQPAPPGKWKSQRHQQEYSSGIQEEVMAVWQWTIPQLNGMMFMSGLRLSTTAATNHASATSLQFFLLQKFLLPL
jgi:hypothetical protein